MNILLKTNIRDNTEWNKDMAEGQNLEKRMH